jgi:hypothetical protein
MDQIDKINNETKEISELTLKELHTQGESLNKTYKNLNTIDNNINLSKIIIDNMSSLNNRLYNFFFKKKDIETNNEIVIKPEEIKQKSNYDNSNIIYQQIIEIKNLNININNELTHQNDILEDIANKSKTVSDKLYQLNKRI